MKSRRPFVSLLLAVTTIWLVSSGHAQETPPNNQVPPGTPIVIQNLRIDRIDKLIINAAGESRAPALDQRAGRTERGAPPPRAVRKAVRAEQPVVDRRERLIELAPRDLMERGDADNPFSAQGLEIHVLSLGQADSTLVLGPADNQGKRKSLLIDAGEVSPSSRNFETISHRIRTLTGGSHVDYFIATHFHTDHVGFQFNGISGLIYREDITIGTVIDIGDEGNTYFGSARSGTYEKYQDAIENAGDKVQVHAKPQFGAQQITLGGNVSVEVVAFAGRANADDEGVLAKVQEEYPSRYQNSPPSENDLSVAVKISKGNFEFFTAGDLTGAEDSWGGTRLFTHKSFGGGKSQTYTNTESWLVNHWAPADIARHDVEVYRANHHGSKNSTSEEFLKALDPEFVIYSCGGKYDHPSRPVVQAVAYTAAQLATTKLAASEWPSESEFRQLKGEIVGGDIQIYVDPSGTWYWINGELHRAFSDAEEKTGDDEGEEDVQRTLDGE